MDEGSQQGERYLAEDSPPAGNTPGGAPDRALGDSAAEDAAARRLFARHLADEPLPPAARDRVTLRVLDEVRHTRPTAVLSPVGADATWFDRARTWLRSLTPKQSLLMAGAGALVALLLFVAISRLTPRPLSITAEVNGGRATILNRHSDKFRIQGDGDLLKLREGDQILTEEGIVRLSHLVQQVAVIEPGARVELTRVDEADGGRQLALRLLDGIVHSTIDEPLQPQDQYVINTPNVTVTAVGTDFTVEAVSEQETLVTTFAGEVTVTMDDQVVKVGPGEEVDAVAGNPLVVVPADGKYGGPPSLLIAVPTGEGVQLYAQPRADSAPVGRLTGGLTLTIQAEDPGGQWVQVCCIAGKAAWVKVR